MRFLLLIAVCSLTALAATDDKKKRDILPGDPRYGTDYHHEHHSTHENEVELSRSHGGYVGSYAVPEVKTSYGPPNYQPGKPITAEQLPTVVENNVPAPSPSYGVAQVQTVEPVKNQYLPPVVEKTTNVRQYHVPQTTVRHDTVRTDYAPPSIATAVTSYGSPVTVGVKTEKQVYKPVVPYEVPAVKTSDVPSQDNVNVDTTVVHTTLEKTVLPEVKVHDHVHEQKTVHTTEVKTPVTLPAASGVVQDASVVDTSLLGTNTGVFPSTDLSGFSNVAPSSFNRAFDGHVLTQPGFVNFESTYGLQGNNKAFETPLPNVYGSSFGTSGSYVVPQPQSYHLPQTLHSQQVYSPAHYSPFVPYALTKSSLYQPSFGVDQKTGPIADFFQDNFPNFQFPQLPQLPQFPNLGAIFQLPTQAPEAAPLDTVEADVPKHTEQKVLNVAEEHVVKTVPVSAEISSTKGSTVVTKTTKEYTQPLDTNGGYVY